MGLREVEQRWSEKSQARASYVMAASHTAAALAKLDVVRAGDRLVVFADDFEDAIQRAFPDADLCFLESPTVEAFQGASVGCSGGPAADGFEGPRLIWFVNSIGGYGLRVPNLRQLGKAARACGAYLVVDNTVASYFGCCPLYMGACLSLEALDRVCGGVAEQKLVAVSVARSQLKRHKIDTCAERMFQLVEAAHQNMDAVGEHDVRVLSQSLDTSSLRMQMHFDRARALAEFLAANEVVPQVFYPGLASHPDHVAATGVLLHGFGPAIEFDTPRDRTAADVIAALPDAYRSTPAGGSHTRFSAVKGPAAHRLRLFAGTDNPLQVAADLDRALRGPTR